MTDATGIIEQVSLYDQPGVDLTSEEIDQIDKGMKNARLNGLQHFVGPLSHLESLVKTAKGAKVNHLGETLEQENYRLRRNCDSYDLASCAAHRLLDSYDAPTFASDNGVAVYRYLTLAERIQALWERK